MGAFENCPLNFVAQAIAFRIHILRCLCVLLSLPGGAIVDIRLVQPFIARVNFRIKGRRYIDGLTVLLKCSCSFRL